MPGIVLTYGIGAIRKNTSALFAARDLILGRVNLDGIDSNDSCVWTRQQFVAVKTDLESPVTIE